MVVIDSVVCLFFDVFGNNYLVVQDLYSIGLLEYFYYMCFVDFRGLMVFEVFMLGNYKKIEQWC